MKKLFYPNTILQLIGLLTGSIVLTTPILFVVRDKLSADLQSLILFVAMFISIMLIVILVNRKREIKLDISFSIKNIFLLLLFISSIVFFQIGLRLPLSKIADSLQGIDNNILNPFKSVIYVLTLVVFVPIIEEIIFRGVILKGLLTKHSAKKSIIISTIIFTVVHVNPSLFPQAFLFGLLSGWIYYKTKSLGFSIILHSTTNLFSLLSGYFSFKFGSPIISSSSDFYGDYSIIIILISIILFVYVLGASVKKMKTIDSKTR